MEVQSQNLRYEAVLEVLLVWHKVKALLMKLVYNSTNEIIENNLSESNIEARKRSPRDHLFVLNAIINDILQKKKKKVLT